MKPIIFAVLSTLFYAIANVIMENKFSKYNNLTIMICYCAVILAAAAIIRQVIKTPDPSFSFPTGWLLLLVIVMGALFFLADFFYIGAYTNGGSLASITTIVIMMPVFASVIKFCLDSKMPNIWQVAGYAMAVLAIFCISKGTGTTGG
jgi:drug/metabolite transporter (DMT)-like permease